MPFCRNVEEQEEEECLRKRVPFSYGNFLLLSTKEITGPWEKNVKSRTSIIRAKAAFPFDIKVQVSAWGWRENYVMEENPHISKLSPLLAINITTDNISQFHGIDQ